MNVNRKETCGLMLLFLLGIALLSSCGPSDPCLAPEFVVTKTADTNDGSCTAEDCSLREAVVLANFCPGPQTIRVPSGTYVLDRVGSGEDNADTGDLDITDDVTILGDMLAVIDGDAADRVFEIHDSSVVSMINLVVQNGEEQMGAGILNEGELSISNSSILDNHAVVPMGGSGYAVGGGVFNGLSASMTVEDSQINNNTADDGGGIANFTSVLVVTDSDICDNTATKDGGGLWNQIVATATLNNAVIEGNLATDDGGGIHNYGALEMNGGNLTRNEASRGGGLFNSDVIATATEGTFGPGDVTLNDVRINANAADDAGAGVYNAGHFEVYLAKFAINSWPTQGGGMFNGPDAEAFLYDAWFTNNTADLGGGLYNQGLIHFYRSSFTVNSAPDGLGGAIYNDNAMPGVLLRNVTVSGNMADPAIPSGGGIYNHGGDMDISFSTFAYNSRDGILNDAGGHMGMKSSILAYHPVNCTGVGNPSIGYNIDDANTCGFIEPSDMVNTDPLLAWLALNGGTNLSHAPLPGSPAIDTGDPSMCTADDQRSVSRPQGLQCDRGSIEVTDEPLPTLPPGAGEPISIVFTDDGHDLTFGQCTTLHWTVENATHIKLNGNPVEAQGLEYTCPQSTTTYILLAWNAQEQQQEAITVYVYLEPPAMPAQFSISSRTCNEKQYFLTLQWIDMADNETGYRVYRDGVLIATLGANADSYTDNNPSCNTSHTYGVEAYNDAGASSRPTLVERGCTLCSW
ncbi:MAG TPA: CSLREA domain-containing protein [Anaerolineae bacterium]|nr:CSLREA domain-containing protein [Anaerolineae bacterium]